MYNPTADLLRRWHFNVYNPTADLLDRWHFNVYNPTLDLRVQSHGGSSCIIPQRIFCVDGILTCTIPRRIFWPDGILTCTIPRRIFVYNPTADHPHMRVVENSKYLCTNKPINSRHLLLKFFTGGIYCSDGKSGRPN